VISAWTPAHVAAIDPDNRASVPDVGHPVRPVGGEHRYYWDMWPVQHADGTIARLGERELWMALSAPDRDDPGRRHFEADIRWLEKTSWGWADRGPVLPPYSTSFEREWAGSALFDEGRLTLFFTGAGIAERPGGYQQRLFEASAPVAADGAIGAWTQPRPSIVNLTSDYCAADAHEGEPGRIKAFRDPAFFRDPADGRDYLIFTASLAGTSSPHNGAVGIARREAEGWVLLPPLVHANGVNNELERAHVVFHEGHYYLFWVTQRATFAPETKAGPTGLYGMVAEQLSGPWRPINGSGLVLANPLDDPGRAYSWYVTAEGIVASFVDDPAGTGFAGVPAPLLWLEFRGDRVCLADRIAAA
jgi:levansucrase